MTDGARVEVFGDALGTAEPKNLRAYQEAGGYEGLRSALSLAPEDVCAAVDSAGLQGRGGANFPTARKWSLLPPGRWPRYLVINGDESEPGTYKDRLIMERSPHQLIEGALIAAYAFGAGQVFLYIRGEMALAQERVIQAVNEAYREGLAGRGILGSDFSVDIVVHPGAGAYIVGEETALLESLEGNRGMPRVKPPYYPASIGLYGQPTIVNNVETIATLPFILSHGPETYSGAGVESARGSRLVAVSGHVQRPGVFEVEIGQVTFRDLLYGASFGRGIKGGQLKAFIPGGASSPWFFEEQLDLPYEMGEVGAAGSMLGSGAVVAMNDTVCVVKSALRLVRFFARESCGKCTPCREGTTWLERVLQRIEDGHATSRDVDLMMDVADNISPAPFPQAGSPGLGIPTVPFPYKMTTICFLAPSAISPIASMMVRFREEVMAHLDGAGCPGLGVG